MLYSTRKIYKNKFTIEDTDVSATLWFIVTVFNDKTRIVEHTVVDLKDLSYLDLINLRAKELYDDIENLYNKIIIRR